MTEQEAQEILQQIAYDGEYPIGSTDAFGMAIKALEEIKQYRALGTVEELRVARDKQVAKKEEWIFDKFTATFGKPYRCSNCEEEFDDTYNYCPNCGCDMYSD